RSASCDPRAPVALGQGAPVVAPRLARLPSRDRVEPAAPPLASGDDAKFAAAFAEFFADCILELGGKRPTADARRIGLGNPKNKAHRARSDTRPGGGLPGQGVRRGNERVSTVVDVEHRALRAFEQDALRSAARLVEQAPYRSGIG